MTIFNRASATVSNANILESMLGLLNKESYVKFLGLA